MHFLFLTALKAEAKPIISAFNLCKEETNRIYSKNDFSVFITGVGEKKTIPRIHQLMNMDFKWDETIIINIGIAGGHPKTTSLGECYLIHKITTESTGVSYFPDILTNHDWGERSLITCNKPITQVSIDYPELVDMESAYIYHSMLKIIPSHRMIFIKIVSDHMDIINWREVNIENLIQNHIISIQDWISNNEWSSFKDRQIISKDELNILHKGFAKIRCTIAQQHQLVDSIEKYKKLYNRSPNLSHYFEQKPKSKSERNQIIKKIKHELSA